MDGSLDDRTFHLRGDTGPCGLLDYLPSAHPGHRADLGELFAPVEAERGDSLVVFGWAMAEDLAAATLPA